MLYEERTGFLTRLSLRSIFKMSWCSKRNFYLKHPHIIAAVATRTTSNANSFVINTLLFEFTFMYALIQSDLSFFLFIMLNN